MKKVLCFTLSLCVFVLPLVAQLEIPKCKDNDVTHQHKTYSSFTLCYRTDWNEPEWVAYELTAAEAKSTAAPRVNAFRADPALQTCTPNDYSAQYGAIADGSEIPYDKGHMSPARDNQFSAAAMSDCFYMSNMCPQLPNFNRKAWRILEAEGSHLAQKYSKVWIVTGPVMIYGSHQIIGKIKKIQVPDQFYKIFVVLDGTNYKAWAWLMPDQSLPITSRAQLVAAAHTYQVTIDKLEQLTGIDFYPDLPDDIENALESSVTYYTDKD